MHLLSLTLDGLAANVALDQALLDAAEAGQLSAPVLRLWEPAGYGVVLGRGSLAEKEVSLSACRQRRIPIIRRCSGGGAVVTGQGCLMYALVLPLDAQWRRPANAASPTPRTAPRDNAGFPNRDIGQVHIQVLERIAGALNACGVRAERAGTSDLAILGPDERSPRKVSGNSLRLKRHWLLYHGTLLYAFDLALAEHLLGAAPRPPAYRQNRGHAEFLANLPITRESLATALTTAWNAQEPLDHWPQDRVATLLSKQETAS